MDLTTLIITWVVVTTIVVVLAYMRLTMGLHDVLPGGTPLRERARN